MAKPSLTHVYWLRGGKGWERVTAQHAREKLDGGISYKSEMFFCSCCNQFATLIDETELKTGVRSAHFKHPAGSRHCDDKTASNGGYRKTYPHGFSLPLKLWHNGQWFTLSIGFLPPREEQLNGHTLAIHSNRGTKLREYRVENGNFSSNYIRFLQVGEEVCTQYLIKSPLAGGMLWPSVVEGVPQRGALFDARTGLRLTPGADARLGAEYWLLMSGDPVVPEGVGLEFLLRRGRWSLYTVKAQEISYEAVKFFLNWGALLTARPARLVPLWPPCVRGAYTIHTVAPHIWFYRDGEGYADVFPEQVGCSLAYNPFCVNITGPGQPQVLSVRRERDTALSLGFVLPRRADDLTVASPNTAVRMFDLKDNALEAGLHERLPAHGVLCIYSPFDGFVERVRNGVAVSRVALNGKETLSLHDVAFGEVFAVYQGLTKSAEIAFRREYKQNNRPNDDEAVYKLRGFSGRETAAPYHLAAVAARLQNMPKTRVWLLERVRLGTIDERAAAWIREFSGRLAQ